MSIQMAGKTSKTSAPQDPIAWAADQGISPQSVNSPHFVLGYLRGALGSATRLSPGLRDALTLIEAHCAPRDMRAGSAK